MKIRTSRFGEVEIPDEKRLSFPAGLPGFAELTEWCLLHSEGAADVSWLQSAEDPDIALIIVDPEAYFEDYDVEVDRAELAPLGVPFLGPMEEPPPIAIRVVVSVSENGDLTANLRAPILIHLDKKLGMQLPLSRGSYAIRQPLAAREKAANDRPRESELRAEP